MLDVAPKGSIVSCEKCGAECYELKRNFKYNSTITAKDFNTIGYQPKLEDGKSFELCSHCGHILAGAYPVDRGASAIQIHIKDLGWFPEIKARAIRSK